MAVQYTGHLISVCIFCENSKRIFLCKMVHNHDRVECGGGGGAKTATPLVAPLFKAAKEG